MKRKEFESIKQYVNDVLSAWNDYDKVSARKDELGKLIQVGAGTEFDPIKYWKTGMEVVAGKWYQCYNESGYIWEAIKTGVPENELDKTYFDIVGI